MIISIYFFDLYINYILMQREREVKGQREVEGLRVRDSENEIDR